MNAKPAWYDQRINSRLAGRAGDRPGQKMQSRRRANRTPAAGHHNDAVGSTTRLFHDFIGDRKRLNRPGHIKELRALEGQHHHQTLRSY
jgi:hypothetical protein